MDPCSPEIPRFFSEGIIKSSCYSTIFTPSPVRNKLKNFAELITASEVDFEKRLEKQDKGKESSFSNGYLNRKLHSCMCILSEDKDIGKLSETESYVGSTEPNSPEKQISESRDEGLGSEGSFEEMIYEVLPSRASNPHIFDDYFERNILNDEDNESGGHEQTNFDEIFQLRK